MIARVLWALGGALLFPLLLAQGRFARLRTPRLPVARGETTGVAGGDDDAPLTLAVVGESPVAGVGVETYEQGLAACLAVALARRTGRAVRWHALGENGATAAAVLERLLPRVPPLRPVAVVVVLGVNDTTGFTSLRAWRAVLRQIVDALRPAIRGPILFTGVPPMGSFTALPQPLRWWIGLRAAMLDRELRAIAQSERGAAYATAALSLDPQHLAADGYHPSAAGCVAWADSLAAALAQGISTTRGG